MKTKTAFAVLLLWAIHGCAVGVATSTDTLANCGLKGPPAGATKGKWGASDVRFFPPSPGPTYTGCLWTWIVHSDGMQYLETVLKFQQGKLIHYRSTEQPSKGAFIVTECSYESSKLSSRSVEPSGSSSTWDCVDPEAAKSLLIRPAERK